MLGVMAEWPGSDHQGGCGSFSTQETKAATTCCPVKCFDILTTDMALSEILLYFK